MTHSLDGPACKHGWNLLHPDPCAKCAAENAISSDEMEAESNKYSDRAVIVLALVDGTFAVFNNQRKLHAIVHSEDLLATIASVKCEKYDPPRAEPVQGVSLNLSDLGL